MTNASRYWAIVPAAGIGSRFQTNAPKQNVPKQYASLGSFTVLEHSLLRLLDIPAIEKICVVLHADDHYWSQSTLAKHPKIITTIGGAERYESVYNGLLRLESIAAKNDWVLVHDAARPCVLTADIQRLMQVVGEDSVGGLLGAPLVDTLKHIDDQGKVTKTLDRTGVWSAYTPQMFRLTLLQNALHTQLAAQTPVTDEAMAIESMGFSPTMVEGSKDNIKITLPSDLISAKAILKRQGVISCE